MERGDKLDINWKKGDSYQIWGKTSHVEDRQTIQRDCASNFPSLKVLKTWMGIAVRNLFWPCLSCSKLNIIKSKNIQLSYNILWLVIRCRNTNGKRHLSGGAKEECNPNCFPLAVYGLTALDNKQAEPFHILLNFKLYSDCLASKFIPCYQKKKCCWVLVCLFPPQQALSLDCVLELLFLSKTNCLSIAAGCGKGLTAQAVFLSAVITQVLIVENENSYPILGKVASKISQRNRDIQYS